MLETIPFATFVKKLATLSNGDIAHHSMIYPGIYPSDREHHERVRAGGNIDTDTDFFRAVKTAIGNGARIEWLCTLPRGKEFGSTEEDAHIRLRTMGAIAALGVDVRSVIFSDYAPAVIEACGDDSPVVQDVLAGLERGDPRKSSWALFRQQAGRFAITHLDTMDYEQGEFLGRTLHYPPGPVDPAIAKWTYLWREVYTNNAEPVSPQSF